MEKPNADIKERKVYWSANTSSGGTLSLSIDLEGIFSREEKEQELAHAIKQSIQHMENSGFIPFQARTMSSRDIAEVHGKSRQYWEKLLSEAKIRYKETRAGRITTDLWVQGYLDDKENVDKYVHDVRAVIASVEKEEKKHGTVICPNCQKGFTFNVNGDDHINGICRSCGFYVHSSY